MDNLVKNKFVPRSRRKDSNESAMFVVTQKPSGAWRMWLLLFIFVVVFGGIVYLLFFSPYFKINSVTIEGGNEEMQTSVREMVSWETEYIVVLNEQSLASSIKKRWLDLADVQVQKVWPDQLKISLIPEVPKLVWNSSSKLYLLNKSGVVLGLISEDERLKRYNNLPVVSDLSGLPVEEGKKIISRDFVTFIDAVKTQVSESLKKEIEGYEIKETTFSLEVKMRDGYKVFFDTLREPDYQIQKLALFLKQEVLVDDYVDLRLPGRVYYK